MADKWSYEALRLEVFYLLIIFTMQEFFHYKLYKRKESNAEFCLTLATM